MGWFNRHLNLSWLMYMVATMLVLSYPCYLITGSWTVAGNIVGTLLGTLFAIPVNMWVLKRKRRDYGWLILILIGGFWIPLVLTNKTEGIKYNN
jgi:hypothetical protein